jgi:homoserine acetyltransferase
VLPNARIGYLTLGELNAARDNVVVCPTWFTAVPADTAFAMTGPGRALDPERWFIVVPNHFGAGVSSSPSNTPPPFEQGRFPRVTTYDSARAQHRLLTEGLGVERIRLATSWSMGACQVYTWAAAYSGMVDAIAPIAGSARTADYNKVFLAGNIAAIKGDAAWNEGFYDRPPVAGVRAMATIYAGWGLSEQFYRNQEYRLFGARSWHRWRPGGTTTSATTRASQGTSRPHWRPSARGRSSCRPSSTATSRRSTLSTRPATDERRVPRDPVVLGPHGAARACVAAIHRRGAAGAAWLIAQGGEVKDLDRAHRVRGSRASRASSQVG